MKGREKIIFALDVGGYDEAIRWVERLGGEVGLYKIGKQLFTACGPKIVEEIIKGGSKVFLDLKYHDIPNTVASAALEAAKLGVSIFTLHASGGRTMIGETCKKLADFAQKTGRPKPIVAAVTVLTSMGKSDLEEIGITASPEEQVLRLAEIAIESGADAIVCSPKEIELLRKSLGGGFKIITPGIRAAGSAGADDQKRTMCAGDAVYAGADYLVVGRPIKDAVDPLAAARRISDEIEEAEKRRRTYL